MKIVILLNALLLCCIPAFGQSESPKIPLEKEISIEKLILADKYETALKKCRTHTKKSARESCLDQKKEFFGRAFEELQQNPKAYFSAKERNAQDEKSIEEANKQGRK